MKTKVDGFKIRFRYPSGVKKGVDNIYSQSEAKVEPRHGC